MTERGALWCVFFYKRAEVALKRGGKQRRGRFCCWEVCCLLLAPLCPRKPDVQLTSSV